MLRYLVKQGADLSAMARDAESGLACSALQLLVHNAASAFDTLINLLNDGISLNEFPVTDLRSQISVEFHMLAPPSPEETIEVRSEQTTSSTCVPAQGRLSNIHPANKDVCAM